MLLFCIKVGAGFLFYFVYKYYYNDDTTSDTFKFYTDAIALNNVKNTDSKAYLDLLFGFDADNPKYYKYIATMNNWVKAWNFGLFNDNRAIIRFNALLLFLSFKNYFVHIILGNFITYIGFKWIHHFFYYHYKNYTSSLIIAFCIFLAPSTLFWSSGVLKEILVVFLLGLLLKLIMNYQIKKQVLTLLLMILVTTSFLWIKVYALPPIIITIFWWLCCKKIYENYSLTKITLLSIVFILGAIVTLRYFTPINLMEILRQKQFDFINYSITQKASSLIYLNAYNGSLIGLIKLIPSSIYTTLFSPTIFELNGAFMYVNFLENLCYFGLFIYMIFYFNRTNKKLRFITVGCIAFVLSLAFIIGATTPVIGAIVRYKIPLIPFLLIPIMAGIDNYSPLKKIIKKWQEKLHL